MDKSNSAGTSFAPLAQGTNGRITSTTFSSVGASFPNDGSLIGQYLSIFNGAIYAVYRIGAWVSSTSLTIAAISGGTGLANQSIDRQYYIGGRWRTFASGATLVRTIPGDTIRVIASPDPTSLGQNGVWTSQIQQAAKAISSSTNTTPISVTCNAHGYSTGDTIVITGHLTNTNANGTWEITNTGVNTFTLTGSAGNGVGSSGTARLCNNMRVLLTSAVTANIASTGPGRAAWTSAGGANVTASLNTVNTKEHARSDQITIAAGFTTGRAAFWATGTLDLSGYQQVSFWIQQTGGTIGAAGAIDLRLCSDTTGTTAVNTISVPSLAAIGRWMPVTVNLNTNLGSNIQSIALYVNTDNGAQTFLLSNIIACKASSADDSLTLTSLIGKNTATETFWGIQSINGTRVMLDAETNIIPSISSLRGYYGISETITTWKRETIKIGPSASASTAVISLLESGVEGSPTTYSGGWNRTDMSTKTSETWLDGVNGNGNGIVADSRNWMVIQGFALTRFNNNISSNIGSWIVYDIIASNNSTNSAIFTSQVSYGTYNIGFIVSAGGPSISGLRPNVTVSGAFVSNFSAMFISGNIAYVKGANSSILFANNGSYGLNLSSGTAYISSLIFKDNPTSDIYTGQSGFQYLKDVALNSPTPVTGFGSYSDYLVTSQNDNQTANSHRIFMHGAIVSSATDQRNTNNGISWKIQPTNTERSANWPVTLSLAKVACAANSLVTVKAWMRRDNAGLTMRLVCKGGQIAGVVNNVTSSVVAVNAWEEETVTFTPTETGVVEITAEAFGGTTFSGWVDDLTISQA
jgi:hypothetical protein